MADELYNIRNSFWCGNYQVSKFIFKIIIGCN